MLKTALELESCQLASRQRAKTVHEVHVEGTQQLEDTQAVAASAAIMAKLQQYVEALQHHMKETVRGKGRRRTTRQRRRLPQLRVPPGVVDLLELRRARV